MCSEAIRIIDGGFTARSRSKAQAMATSFLFLFEPVYFGSLFFCALMKLLIRDAQSCKGQTKENLDGSGSK